MYRYIIFDLDGTLLNTLEDLKDSTNYALRACGYPERDLQEIRSFVGNGIQKLIERAVPEHTGNEQVKEVFALFYPYYLQHCQEKTSPYDGIPEVLDALQKQGCRIAVVSNKGDAAVKELVAHYFGGYIDVAIGERTGISRKPAPDSVWEAMRILGAQAEDTVYVGDSDVDYQTAANAGVDCICVTWGFRDEKELRKLQPKYLIHRPEELHKIIGL